MAVLSVGTTTFSDQPFTASGVSVLRFSVGNYSTFHWAWGHGGSINLSPGNLDHVQQGADKPSWWPFC